MTILYETDAFEVRHVGEDIFAGYKGDKMYPVPRRDGVVPEDFKAGDKWRLSYKKGVELVLDAVGEYGGNISVNGESYRRLYRGRYINSKGQVLYEAWLERIDDDGDFVTGYLLGYTSETEFDQ